VASESIQKPKVKRIRKNQKSNQGKSHKNAAAAANSPNSGKRSSIYRGVTRYQNLARLFKLRFFFLVGFFKYARVTFLLVDQEQT
jgi:hypothetical protein